MSFEATLTNTAHKREYPPDYLRGMVNIMCMSVKITSDQFSIRGSPN